MLKQLREGRVIRICLSAGSAVNTPFAAVGLGFMQICEKGVLFSFDQPTGAEARTSSRG
jgi:hypothetical protein